jgi:hypothetical protein
MEFTHSVASNGIEPRNESTEEIPDRSVSQKSRSGRCKQLNGYQRRSVAASMPRAFRQARLLSYRSST